VKLTVLLLEEGPAWVAQCLEHDIAAQGASMKEALEHFQEVFNAQVAYDLANKREPLAGKKRAPDWYWRARNYAEPLGGWNMHLKDLPESAAPCEYKACKSAATKGCYTRHNGHAGNFCSYHADQQLAYYHAHERDHPPSLSERLAEISQHLEGIRSGQSKPDVIEYRREGDRVSVLVKRHDGGPPQ
jgi:hypothetical protein